MIDYPYKRAALLACAVALFSFLSAGCFGPRRASFAIGFDGGKHTLATVEDELSMAPSLEYESSVVGGHMHFTSFQSGSNTGGEAYFGYQAGNGDNGGDFVRQEAFLGVLFKTRDKSTLDFEVSVGFMMASWSVDEVGVFRFNGPAFGFRSRYYFSSPLKTTEDGNNWGLGMFLQPSMFFGISSGSSLTTDKGPVDNYNSDSFNTMIMKIGLGLYYQVDRTLKYGYGVNFDMYRLEEAIHEDMTVMFPESTFSSVSFFFEMAYDF